MASDDASLVKEATVLLDKFGASEQSLDAFIEDAEKDLKNMDAQHKKFVLHVVSGCTEYKKLLDVVVNVFYGQNGRWLSIGDRSQFAIICYLTTFVLDDIGLQRFSNIVKSLDIKKMHTFLDFFFTHLTTWIQDKWNRIYDAACVEEQWIGPLLRWRPHIDILMDELHLKLSRGSKFKKTLIKTTKLKEFDLTKLKPRPLPMPELIPQQNKCKPVPNSTYRAPKEMQIIKEMKHENREKTTELLNEANMLQFSFVNRPRSERRTRVMTQVQKDLNSKLQFNSKHSIKPPSSKTENSPVKLNIAMKLREKALRNHKKEKELKRVVRLAEGGGELSSFLQWQKNMREMELHEELAKIEQRRLERRIGHVEAAFPPKAIIERNRKASKLKREESAQRLRAIAWQKLLDEKELKNLVQQVVEEEKKPAIAREKLQKFKQSIGREVFEQSQVLRRQLLEEAQAEESRRFQTVLEIRAIESLPHVRFKYFDNTETAGHELLDEMSIIELKLRTAHLKEYRQTEKQKRHEQILEVNQKKKRLDKEMEAEYLHTRAMAQAAAIRKEKERKDIEQKIAREKVLVEEKKLREQKEQERQRLEQIKSSMAKTAEPTKKTTMTAEEICLVGSQTTLAPAVVSTTFIENVTSLTVTPMILSSTTPGCSAFNTSTCEPCAPGSQYDNSESAAVSSDFRPHS
ncbi:cilia- and flagella-associated protein 99-like [Limanda limanda]|uniref:cilia- and flagella-associated protein 99-like n=1 Tax=Limanda limanda TaxID=27771 RepID=UPI0029C78996|nr:cilia- and flagella-associated protein 99-like [Limanda limanda]